MKRFIGALLIPVGVCIGFLLRGYLETDSHFRSEPPSHDSASLLSSRIAELEFQHRTIAGELQLARQGRGAARVGENAITAASQNQAEPDAGDPRITDPLDKFQYSEQERVKARMALESKRADLLSMFASESRDPSWAGPMVETLERSLSEVASSPSTTSGVSHSIDCKTSVCIATFKWPNYKAALANYTAADISSTDCTRFMLLDEPVDQGAPYSTDLILQCKRK